MKDHGLLVEKYRPTELKHFVGNEHIKKTIQQYLDQGDIQNFIFYGPAGTGKTYTSVALAVRALKDKQVKRIILTVSHFKIRFGYLMSCRPLSKHSTIIICFTNHSPKRHGFIRPK